MKAESLVVTLLRMSIPLKRGGGRDGSTLWGQSRYIFMTMVSLSHRNMRRRKITCWCCNQALGSSRGRALGNKKQFFEDVTHRSFAAWKKKPYMESWLPAFFSWDKQLSDFTACVSLLSYYASALLRKLMVFSLTHDLFSTSFFRPISMKSSNIRTRFLIWKVFRFSWLFTFLWK